MRSVEQVRELLFRLDHQIADELKDQDLNFKQWDPMSMNDGVRLVVSMAICMANGGGGTVVFGIADKVIGRDKAFLGIPSDVEVNKLKQAVYDQTDPKITPVFEEWVPIGSDKRLLIMQVYPGIPPYTDTSGRGTVRIGKV